MSYGERLVGVTFNPSGSDAVDEIKAQMAKLIDLVRAEATSNIVTDTAIMKALDAQMWMVKAIFYK